MFKGVGSRRNENPAISVPENSLERTAENILKINSRRRDGFSSLLRDFFQIKWQENLSTDDYIVKYTMRRNFT